jgi:hypothetical protein
MTTYNRFHAESGTIVKVTVEDNGDADFVVIGDDSWVSDEDLIQMVAGNIPRGWADNSF